MRIVMMGTGAFAVPTFEAILQAGHTIPALVTRPVPPATGRKKDSLHPNPMRDFAEAHDIPVIAPESTHSSDCHATLQSWSPDLFVVCDFGEILSNETLALARLGGINLHASLLPKYRGAAPINWAILRGEQETGISVIHMTPKLDGGPILTDQRTPIGENETAAELEPRLARLGIASVLQAIELLQNWDGRSLLGKQQDSAAVTSARRLRKSDGNVIWSRSAQRIRNQLRALKPWPGLFTHLLKSNAPPLRLILDWLEIVLTPDVPTLQPGQIVAASRHHAWVQTGDGIVSLERVQPAGKRIMPIAEFLHGHPLEVGMMLGEASQDGK
jgi:methionyl-tRNA formyltransferase